MQRRNFLKATAAFATIPAIKGLAAETEKTNSSKEIYEWRIYTLTGDGTILDNFFKDALIPAYNRKGVKAGAFTLYKKEDTEKRFLLLVYPDIVSFHTIRNSIWSDNVFTKAAQSFYDKTAPDPAYKEYESYICEAFDKIPTMLTPDKNRTLFELRHYHSPNDEANRRKVKMFNVDEIDVFDKVGINSVCYGDVLAGPHMPALMYLTWYKDEPTRNEAWGKFSKHPDWIRIKDMKEYAYTATNNTNRLLSPMPYSQI